MMELLLFTALVAALAGLITAAAYLTALILLWWDRRTAARSPESTHSTG